MTRVNIDDAKNYKKCSTKSYEVYACIPEKGTCIINRLHNTDLYKRYRKEYMTAEQAKKYQGLPLADGNQVCIYGVAGEFSLVPLQVVLNNYVLENGMSVSVDELKKRWVKLKAKSNFREFFACFVPKIQIEHLGRMTVNGDGNFINHGKGDFIVCDSVNGKPNMNTRRVVNGLIFSNTYNNQGWTNCISSVNLIAYENLPNLVSEKLDYKGINVRTFKNKVNTILSELAKYYKFTVGAVNYREETDFRGLKYEINFKGNCGIIETRGYGNFEYTYTYKDKVITRKPKETQIVFAVELDYVDSAISMSLGPIVDGRCSILSGWAFPENSNTLSDCNHWSCKTGTISDINCKEEVLKYIRDNDDRDRFIDNRKSAENKEEIISKKIITIIGLFKEHYKFKIVSISNEIVNEYHGIMKEYYFEGKTVVYKYTLEVKGEKVGIMIASKINGTSPIVMSVLRKKEGLQGCCFPSNVKRNNNRELECFTSVTQLNCKEVVDKEIKAKTFDDYLDNRIKETNFALEQNEEEFDFSGIFDDIRKIFEDNGFLVLKDEKGYDTYKIVLSGDNDDTIAVLVKIEPKDLDYKILIKAKSNNKTLNKAKVFSIVEDSRVSVYKVLLSPFALNNTNRCDKVMQLVATYRKEKYTKNEIEKKTYEYVFGAVKVTAILDNDSIIYKYNGKEIVTNHFDNVRTIAGKVNDLIKEKENEIFNEIDDESWEDGLTTIASKSVDKSDNYSYSSDNKYSYSTYDTSYNYKYTPDDLYNECEALLKELHNEYYLDSELVDYGTDDRQINIVFDNETKSARMYLNDKYGFVFNYGLSYVTFSEVTWNVVEDVYKMLDN